MPVTDLFSSDSDEQHHSDAVAQVIKKEMRSAGGSIDFARFMELALYAPGLGYYSAGRRKFGAGGDFITAPEMGPAFARCIARQCRQVLWELGKGDLLEVGAGSGALAAGVLSALAETGPLPEYYFILELSAELRTRQAEYLAQTVPHLAQRVRWLDHLPPHGFYGVVIANELLDAIPTQRFRWNSGGPQLLHVASEHDHFCWRDVPAPDALAAVLSARMRPSARVSGYSSEVNLRAEAWIQSIAETIEAGLVLVIDYGFPRAEFYHPDRSSGTLMCHYRHHAHGDPLVLVGLQDITAHVEFTAIAEAGRGSGLSVLGYTSQAAFLLATGLTEQAGNLAQDDVKAHLQLAQEIKKLTLPHEMGELFKVMALGRGLQGPLSGFTLQDRRARL